jgi:cell division protein FtsX
VIHPYFRRRAIANALFFLAHVSVAIAILASLILKPVGGDDLFRDRPWQAWGLIAALTATTIGVLMTDRAAGVYWMLREDESKEESQP